MSPFRVEIDREDKELYERNMDGYGSINLPDDLGGSIHVNENVVGEDPAATYYTKNGEYYRMAFSEDGAEAIFPVEEGYLIVTWFSKIDIS